MLKRRKTRAGMTLFGVLLALTVFGALAAGIVEWLGERAREQVHRVAGAQMRGLSEAVSSWVESDFPARLAAGSQRVTLATVRAAGVLAPGFAPDGRDALGREYRVFVLRVGGDALDVLVTHAVEAGDVVVPYEAVLVGGGTARIGIVNPDEAPARLRGPSIVADLSGFRARFGDAAPARSIGVLRRHDRQSVFGDFLYRDIVNGLPGANTMETALDMGGNDVVGARNVAADRMILEEDLEVGGRLTVTRELLVRGVATVAGTATVAGEIRTDSARIAGTLSANTAAVTGQARAGNIVAAGEVRGGSIGTPGALSSASATVSGPVVAGSVSAASANVAGRVLAGTVRAGSLTATSVVASGNATVTGAVAAGSVRANGHLNAASAGFSTLIVGNCIGC